jgi:hypothetical protein
MAIILPRKPVSLMIGTPREVPAATYYGKTQNLGDGALLSSYVANSTPSFETKLELPKKVPRSSAWMQQRERKYGNIVTTSI